MEANDTITTITTKALLQAMEEVEGLSIQTNVAVATTTTPQAVMATTRTTTTTSPSRASTTSLICTAKAVTLCTENPRME